MPSSLILLYYYYIFLLPLPLELAIGFDFLERARLSLSRVNFTTFTFNEAFIFLTQARMALNLKQMYISTILRTHKWIIVELLMRHSLQTLVLSDIVVSPLLIIVFCVCGCIFIWLHLIIRDCDCDFNAVPLYERFSRYAQWGRCL